jgi:hypothetical protein
MAEYQRQDLQAKKHESIDLFLEAVELINCMGNDDETLPSVVVLFS